MGVFGVKKKVIIIITAIFIIISFSLISFGLIYSLRMKALKHETNRWAVIKDVNDDKIAVETTNDAIWNQLVNLHSNGSQMFVGSIIDEYNSKWGFRFRPINLTIATITAEGLQATLLYIKENLDYWLGGWAYTTSLVVEINN